MTPVRAICFDLYGTLNIYGDDEAGWDAFVTELHAGFASHGLAMDAAAFREAFADFRALAGRHDPGGKFRNAFLDDYFSG